MSAALSKLHTQFDLDSGRGFAIVAGFTADAISEFLIGDEFSEVEQRGRIWPAVAFVEALAAGTAVLDSPTIWRGSRGGEELSVHLPAIVDLQAESIGTAGTDEAAGAVELTVADLYTNVPAAPTIEASRADLKPAPRLPETPIEQLPPVPEGHPRDRARREWDAFQVFRANNLGEPGDSTGFGGGYACGGDYKPFAS
jgi:hypothetical protein